MNTTEELIQPPKNKNALPNPEKKGYHLQQKITVSFLPPPEELAKYKVVDASFPNRVLSLTEQQAGHRQACERRELERKADSMNKLINFEGISKILGQIFAFLLCLAFILSGYSLITKGYNAGWLVSGIGVASIIIAFLTTSGIYSKLFKKTQSNERE